MELISLIIEYLKLIAASTPEAVVQSVIVLVSVLALRAVKLIPDSKWARAANAVFSVMLSGITPTPDNQILIVMTSALAAGLWELIVLVYTKGLKLEKPFQAVSKKK